MNTIRLYLPPLTIALWALTLVFVHPISHVIRGIAWLTIAAAFWIQVHEARHQHQDRRSQRED